MTAVSPRPASPDPRPAAPAAPVAGEPPERRRPPTPPGAPPFLLDFFPLESPDQTRLAPFFDRLRAGHLSTTRCPADDLLHWPPRIVCPTCHAEALEWVDLPSRGTIYAFSAVLGGAPLGMEAEVPFAVGLVDLDGVPLRLFGRITGRPWSELRIGDSVEVEPFDVGDGRFFYRFRVPG